jgi:hypothetical protein
VLLASCPEPCTVWGDLSKPPSLTATQRMPDGGAEDLGAVLVLQPPPQGGHVAYVGARVQNFEGCRIELTATLYPPDSGLIAAYESRRVDLTVNGGSDPSDPAHFANVPVCPNYGDRDYVGLPWRLVVEAKDRSGKSLQAEYTVVPTCDAGGPQCECECRAGYELGKCGAKDGG